MRLLKSEVISSTRTQKSESLEPPWQESLRDETTASKPTFYAPEKENERVQNQRVEFWSPIRELPAKDRIFVDESGVKLAMLRLDSLGLRRERSSGKSHKKRGKNFSLISACPVQEVVASRKIYGTVDGVTLEAFIVKD